MIQRVLSTLLGVLFFVAVFVFTTILVAIALTAGLLLAGWIRWRARSRRRRVIEGEYRIIESR
jgi:Flp pilus assembly protein TadB